MNIIFNGKVNRSNLHVQHTFLHIIRADDSLRTKISWMHFGRFPFNQNLKNFGNSGNWYSIFPEKFPDFRKLFRNANHSTRNFKHSGAKLNAEKKLPENNFRKFWVYIAKMLFHSVLHGRCRKFKQDVLIEWNGIHAGNQICYQLCSLCARARVRAPLKKFLKSNFSLVWSMKSWFNLTDYWKQKLCFDLFIILISI